MIESLDDELEFTFEEADLHCCSLNHSLFDEDVAVEKCYEDEEGVLWAENYLSKNPVNFCPFCGYESMA